MQTQITTVQESFQFQRILPGLVICEAPASDPHSWGNADKEKPAFLVYLGYNTCNERDNWIVLLQTFWRITEKITTRRSSRVPDFCYEIKIHGMLRFSDPSALKVNKLIHGKKYGLDFLVYVLWLIQNRSIPAIPSSSRLQNLEADRYEDMLTARILTTIV
jgi:hypothetical protein